MAKFVILLVCLVTLNAALALDCYNCFSQGSDKNCDDFTDKSKINVVTCGKTASPNFKHVCLKRVSQETATGATNTSRSCVILNADGSTDTACKAASDRHSVLFCEVCMDDLCNGAHGTLQLNHLAAGVAAVASLAAAKFLF